MKELPQELETESMKELIIKVKQIQDSFDYDNLLRDKNNKDQTNNDELIEKFIDMRIDAIQGLLLTNLPHLKDLILSAILNEYLMMKLFFKDKEG